MFALQTLWVSLQKVFAGEILRRRVMDELGSLSDRDLADIGISRSDIARVAREAAAVEVKAGAVTKAPRPNRLTGSALPV
ncbi:DUF1127 domain-containing protein [Xanthobacter nonsaccharivorans]|uniref:DUF1127 domain-containing protein n=1 Tax=Xanthobacter nonsaccharivorans TaxID=3119912 RepID=UPI00372D220B